MTDLSPAIPRSSDCRSLFALVAIALALAAAANAAGQSHDRILLISTREVGLRCDGQAMRDGLRHEEYVVDDMGKRTWRSLSLAEASAQLAEPMPTVFYVHGNRVSSGMDKSTGLAFYRTLARRRPGDAPLRFVIWSWPSTRIPGRPVHDYEVKAARTLPVGWQLAWTLDQLPAETPLALVGYSYGARVVTGALHLLAGGRMNNLELPERLHPDRPPIRAALLAAAVDAQWLRPGGFHGLALRQVDEMLLVNNQRDPAMRFYRISPVGKGRALGYAGLASVGDLGPLSARVRSIDVTNEVGRHHAIGEYLTAAGPVGRVLEQVAKLPPAAPIHAAAPLLGAAPLPVTAEPQLDGVVDAAPSGAAPEHIIGTLPVSLPEPPAVNPLREVVVQ